MSCLVNTITALRVLLFITNRITNSFTYDEQIISFKICEMFIYTMLHKIFYFYNNIIILNSII